MGQSRSRSGQHGTRTRTAANRGRYDHLFKLLLVGESDTGKSQLLLRFVDNLFSSTFITTIGVDFKIKTVNLDGICGVKLQIWDTSGNERFRTIPSAYYCGASGAMVVYSATKESTFDHVPYWLDEIKRNAPPDTPVVLLGNKCDLVEEKEVEYERARDFADERGLPLFETSAKDGTNVELAFMALVAAVLESQMSEIAVK